MTDKPKFTPGPWRAVTLKEEEQITVASSSLMEEGAPCVVCRIRNSVNSAALSDADCANAHLIAAAPDLYAALEAITESANAAQPSSNELLVGVPVKLVAKAVDELAKARGEG